MASPICVKLPEIPTELSITLPGMGKLVQLRDALDKCERPSNYVLKYLNSISPVMSSIQTYLKVLDFGEATSGYNGLVPACPG